MTKTRKVLKFMQRVQRDNMDIPTVISRGDHYVVISFFWGDGNERGVKSYYYPHEVSNEYKKQICDILRFVRLMNKNEQ